MYFLYKNRQIQLKPYPETMINESETSPTSDVMLIDKDGLPIVSIEIIYTVGVKKDFQKMKQLMEDYEVKEGFVYD